MRRPPPSVALVARTHWFVAGVIVFCVALVHFSTRHLPIAFSTKAYAITLGLAGIFLLAGTLVWLGVAVGQPLSRFCAVCYMMRPKLTFHLWEIMKSPEYLAHFRRRTGDDQADLSGS